MLRTRPLVRAVYSLPSGYQLDFAWCRFQSKYTKPSPPTVDKSANFLVRSLNYVKQVDDYQENLQKSPTDAKVRELMKRIEDKPELLYLLSIFLQQLDKVGVNQSTRDVSTFTYRLKYLLMLHKLHSDFWETCNLLDVSSHNHKLKFNPLNIGILDPTNFSSEDYEQLRKGVYKGTDFKGLTHISFIKPNFKK